MRPDTQAIGKSAEDAARAYLEKKGMRFVAANFRTRLGELDLVMEDKDAVVFVEVKTRRRNDYGRPEEFVTAAKQSKLVKTALIFISFKKLAGRPFRFDVVAVSAEGITHVPNAFSGGSYTL